MGADQLRQAFESAFPPPHGVYFDGDHYHGARDIPGSFRNASEWAAMYRGWRSHAELSRNTITEEESSNYPIGTAGGHVAAQVVAR